jgi:hypothetical protein
MENDFNNLPEEKQKELLREAYDYGYDAYKLKFLKGDAVSDPHNPYDYVGGESLWLSWQNGYFDAAWDYD